MPATSRGLLRLLVVSLTLLPALLSDSLHAQSYCGPNTPTFYVNLVGNPAGSWISPSIQRVDTCCGTTAPNQCVQFIVTLDPMAQGVMFNVFSGAMPPGALFYQVNCGPPTPVGQPLCLSGPGPHTITFCKPGNNYNQYIITSLQQPSVSDSLVLNNGCSGFIGAAGFDESTVTWTSVYPGPQGAYNSYLSCTSACDTVLVSAVAGAPPYVDYLVCGYNIAGCIPLQVCDTIRVYFNPVLTAAIVPQNPTICFGNTGTTITANVTGGSPPYTYQWSNGATTASTYVGPGSYTVTVHDASNCPGTTATVTVTSFTAAITANAGADQHVCATSPAVTLSGAITGASGGIWGGGSGTFSPSNTTLNATYTPSAAEIASGQATLSLITTGNGTCPPDTDFVTIFIHQFNASLQLTSTPVQCFGQTNGSAAVIVTNGNAPFTYAWSTSPVQTGSNATNLAAGNYTVTVTDTYGCSGTGSVIVTQPPVLTATGTAAPVTCFAACNGTATVTATGGTPSYTYAWSPTGGNAASASSLCAGTYSCSITDSKGCTTTATFSITQPAALAATTSFTQATCNASNGSASVSVSGGTGSYTYAWAPTGGNAATATGLAAGPYSCTITDANSCTLTVTVTVPNAAAPTATISATTNISCFGGSNGSATVTPAGGAGGYAYSWSPSGGTNATATGLPQGTFVVTVTDANGCTATATAVLTQPTALTATATAVAVLCNGGSTGSASVNASGGIGPYTYSWSTSPAQTGMNATNLAAGNYSVTVTDANGCTVQATTTVTQPAPLSVTSTGLPAACFNSCDGQLITIPAGGTQPYNFQWSTGCTQPACSNVCAGTYSVTVTDANGCSVNDVATITQPTLLSANATSVTAHCNHADGSAAVVAGGGSPGYTYAWQPTGQTTSSISNITSGNYSVTITDANGCMLTASVTVGNQPGVGATIASSSNVTCPNACNGSATVSASGGNGPYQYSWSSVPVQNTATASNLCAASYSVLVTDANGCQDSASITITQPQPLQFTINNPPWLCIGQSYTLTATATGGTAPYTYNWSSGPVVSPTVTTTYTLTVTDANGCTAAQQTVTVNVHPPLNVTASGGGTTCAGGTVMLTANATGGNGGPYYYYWPAFQSNNSSVNFVPSASANYNVIATDNCTSQQATANTSVFVPTPPIVTPAAVSPEGCANMCTQFSSDAPSSSTVLWHFGDGGTSTAMTPNHCYPQPGSYNVSLDVTDTNGCLYTYVSPNMINVHANPSADFSLGPQPTTILEPQICFTNLSSNDVTQWYWNFGDPNDQTTDTLTNTCHVYGDTGHYCVDLIVHNTYGCWSTVEYCLDIQPYYTIYVPNAFTPNGDGTNDDFKPSLYNVLPDSYSMLIFDRWGNLIFQTTDINEGWDGRVKGKSAIAQIDTYVWKIYVKDYTGKPHQLIGHVSIIK